MCGRKVSLSLQTLPFFGWERERKACGAQLDHAEGGGRSDAQPAAVVAVTTSIDSETQQAVAAMEMARKILDFALGHEIRGRDVAYVGEDVAAPAAKNKRVRGVAGRGAIAVGEDTGIELSSLLVVEFAECTGTKASQGRGIRVPQAVPPGGMGRRKP